MLQTSHSLPASRIAIKPPSFQSTTRHSAGLLIRPASGMSETLACEQLVRRMYAWRGYRTSNQRSQHMHGASRVILAAWQDDDLVATITLTRDNGRGLLCEALYPDEIAELRKRSQRVCEYSRLASDPDFSSPELLEAFFRTAYHYAKKHFGATDAVVEVNPRHRRYYERELGFTVMGPRRTCPRVDAPAMLLHRDLRPAHPEPSALRVA